MSATFDLLIDMDGVLFDFSRAVQNLYKVNVEVRFEEIAPLLHTTKETLVSVVNKAGELFWSDMLFTPFCFELMELLTSYNLPMYICSNPGLFQYSCKGKQKALSRIFDSPWTKFARFKDEKYLKKTIFIKDKHMLANKNRILIDDFESNTNAFQAHGGEVVLVPQSWNRLGYMPIDKLITDVKQQLDVIINK